MKVDIHVFPMNDLTPIHAGYIESDDFDAERFFQMCNWGNFTDQKPEELHSSIRSVGHGVCFTNPITGEKWLAKTFGWFVGNSLEVSEYVRAHKDALVWK